MSSEIDRRTEWELVTYSGTKFLGHLCPDYKKNTTVQYLYYPCRDKDANGNLYCGWCEAIAPKEMQQVALLCGCYEPK